MYQLSGSSSLVAHYSFCASDPADQLSSFCECVCVGHDASYERLLPRGACVPKPPEYRP